MTYTYLTGILLLTLTTACEDASTSEESSVRGPSQNAEMLEEPVQENTELESDAATLDYIACDVDPETNEPLSCVDYETYSEENGITNTQLCVRSVDDFKSEHLLQATLSGQDLKYHISPNAPQCDSEPALDQQSIAEREAIASPIGVIDEIRDGMIAGWACAPGSITNIEVHVYYGGPAGSGTFLQTFLADQFVAEGADRTGLRESCGHSAKTKFRYRLPLDNLADIQGQLIYAYAIHPSGDATLHTELINSGTLSP